MDAKPAASGRYFHFSRASELAPTADRALYLQVHAHVPRGRRILALGMDKELPLTTRIKLRIHYLMCSFCERYAKQLKYMRTVAREFPDKIGEISDAKLPSEAKQRLKEALRE